jgi:thiamine pyrophosphate-dependent acetolactate synthase large subunit-like protein
MMKRPEALSAIAELAPNEIVVSTYSSAFDWLVIRPHPLNYVHVGAMGLASSHGLGLALGRPDRKVIVLDGDGSLLMNLSTLVTIASAGPKNLVYFVCENGIYEANGGHPIPGRGATDFCALAQGAGWPVIARYDDLQAFRSGLQDLLTATGPVFASLHVVPGDGVGPANYEHIHGAHARAAFRDRLLPDSPQ